MKDRTTKAVLCLALGLFCSLNGLQAQPVIRDHRTDERKAQEPIKSTYRALEHYWSSSRTDNYSTATAEAKKGALATSYRYVRTDGYVLSTSVSSEGEAVPLYLYYHAARKDNFTTASPEGIRAAEAAGYRKVRIEGYVLRTVLPEYRHLYWPLWLYYHDARKDNFTIATTEGRGTAEAGGYRQVRMEGYLLKAPDADHAVEEPPVPDVLRVEYLGNYPSDRQTGWSEGLQGVAHDQNHWFFTQKDRIWKFPVTHDLNQTVKLGSLPVGVRSAAIPRSLSSQGYDHFGDLVAYQGYLFIPLEAEEGANNERPLLAVFRADNLAFTGSAPLPAQTKAGWCAIHPSTGILYTSNNHLSSTNKLESYEIDFSALRSKRVVLHHLGKKSLYDEAGRSITLKRYLQGGEFSADGKYLFLINGRASSETAARDGGIWAFNFENGRKVLKSATQEPFKFEYHPGVPNLEEPEGLTYWDLDGQNAPNVKGKLHAILLNNDVTSSDEFWFKHYSITRD